MGIFDIFKRKKDTAVPPSFPDAMAQLGDDFGFGQDLTAGLGGTGELGAFNPQRNPIPPTLERMPNEPLFPNNTFTRSRPFEQQPTQTDLLNKNIEIISYKIDALRAAIDAINQRLANIEAMTKGQQENTKYRW